MKLRYKILIVLGLMGAAYGVGRYLQPAEVKTKTKIKKEYVEVEKEKEKKETRTIEREIKRPDGTVVKEIIEEEIKESESVTKETEKSELKKKKVVDNLKPQWKIGASTSLRQIKGRSYTVEVERRIIGPFFAGVYSRVDFKEYGVSISMEF